MDVSNKPMGIYDVYLLGRSGGKFDKNLIAKTEKTKAVLTKEYAETLNYNYQNSGRWCEYDEEATIEYYQKGEAKFQANVEAEEIKKATTEVLKEAIKEVKKPRKRATTRKKQTPKSDEGEVTI